MRTHKRAHEVNSLYMKLLNHQNGIQWKILSLWNSSITLAPITWLGKIMSIFGEWLANNTHTTRSYAQFEYHYGTHSHARNDTPLNTQHLNLGYTTTKYPIGTTSI